MTGAHLCKAQEDKRFPMAFHVNEPGQAIPKHAQNIGPYWSDVAV